MKQEQSPTAIIGIASAAYEGVLVPNYAYKTRRGKESGKQMQAKHVHLTLRHKQPQPLTTHAHEHAHTYVHICMHMHAYIHVHAGLHAPMHKYTATTKEKKTTTKEYMLVAYSQMLEL